MNDRQIQLERAESNRLMIPLTAFAGHREAFQELFVKEEDTDQSVHTLSRSDADLPRKTASEDCKTVFHETDTGDQGAVDE